jgi:uncharacterized protein YecT (DUF1311 family)
MRAALLAIFLFSPLGALAAEDEPAFQCKYKGSQQKMNACAVRDYKAADRAMNDEYKKLMALLPPVEQQFLRQDQRAWLAEAARSALQGRGKIVGRRINLAA